MALMMLSQLKNLHSGSLGSLALLMRSCSNSSKFNPNFINRNPRSMELLRIARKPQGYCLDQPSVNYWYRLYLKQGGRYLNGYVEHHSGTEVISASTKEWAIRRQLYSAKDACSALNIGRILAYRCHQLGLLEIQTNLLEQRESSERVSLFLQAFEEAGIQLEESPQIREKQTYRNTPKIPTMPWDVTEDQVIASNNVKKTDR